MLEKDFSGKEGQVDDGVDYCCSHSQPMIKH
jgi:hypothetical protein